MSEDVELHTLDGTVREGLAALLDVLLPGTQRLPSGRAVGAHREGLDRVLAADPQLRPAVVGVGRAAGGAAPTSFEDVARIAGEELERLVFALHAAYYLSTEVRDALGYPGQARRPVSQATQDEIASDELLAPVRERGPVYVPTPD